MDEPDLNSSPTLSSSLDDIFYILKKTLYRLLSTGSISAVSSLCRELRMVLDEDVAEVWRSRMETCLKDLQAGQQQGSTIAIGVGAMGGMAAMGGGRAREEEKERREKEARGIFIVCSNFLQRRYIHVDR